MCQLKCIVAALLISFCAYGQPDVAVNSDFLHDGDGHPLRAKADYKTEGSIFLPERTQSASVQLKNGRRFTNVRAKINFADQEMVYEDAAGNLLVPNIPVERVEFTDWNGSGSVKVFRSGYTATGGQADKKIYELLDSGRISLLKAYNISYIDKKEYNSTTTTRIFDLMPAMFLFIPGKGTVRVDPDPKNFTAQLPGNQDQLLAYINQRNLKLRKEKELLQLVKYYNSLTN